MGLSCRSWCFQPQSPGPARPQLCFQKEGKRLESILASFLHHLPPKYTPPAQLANALENHTSSYIFFLKDFQNLPSRSPDSRQ